jgi:hypothetical protein
MKAIKIQNRAAMKLTAMFMLLFLCSASSILAGDLKNTELTKQELTYSEVLTVESNAIFSFSIQENDYVKFSIFDLKGKEITVLVDGNVNKGELSTDLSKANLKEGTYYYKLTVGKHKEVRKLNVSVY